MSNWTDSYVVDGIQSNLRGGNYPRELFQILTDDFLCDGPYRIGGEASYKYGDVCEHCWLNNKMTIGVNSPNHSLYHSPAYHYSEG